MSKSNEKDSGELQRFRREILSLTLELTTAQTTVTLLKKEVQHRQDVATRLIAQRNTAKFLNDRTMDGLRGILKAARCKVNKEATMNDLLEVATQIVNEAAAKIIPITSERNELREELAVVKEDLIRAETRIKELAIAPKSSRSAREEAWDDDGKYHDWGDGDYYGSNYGEPPRLDKPFPKDIKPVSKTTKKEVDDLISLWGKSAQDDRRI